jgi:hypothetical protein
MSREALTIKKYVGNAKIEPDSRTPRRLRIVITTTRARSIGTT